MTALPLIAFQFNKPMGLSKW